MIAELIIPIETLRGQRRNTAGTEHCCAKLARTAASTGHQPCGGRAAGTDTKRSGRAATPASALPTTTFAGCVGDPDNWL